MAELDEPDVTRRVDRCHWRLDAIDSWRKETDKRVAILESEVLTEREARRLAEALRLRGKLQLTRLQAFGGALVGVVALADLVLGLVPR